ncbi:MAG: YceI family protein [Acidimicrobiales bacterium]
MTDPTLPGPAPAASVPPGAWVIDPARTTVVTRTRAMLGLLAVTGRLSFRAGEVHVETDPRRCSVQATVDAASFSSGNARRDADVTSPALLDAAAHPDIVYVSRSLRPEGEAWVVDGDLTVRGTTADVQLRVTGASMDGDIARFRAHATLDRRAFGVTAKRAMVGSTVEITIDAAAMR